MAPCLQHLQLSGNVTLDMQAGLQSTQLTSLMLLQQLDADSLLLLANTQPNLQHLAVFAANPAGHGAFQGAAHLRCRSSREAVELLRGLVSVPVAADDGAAGLQLEQLFGSNSKVTLEDLKAALDHLLTPAG
jgi:hypothetical protein